MLTPNLTYSCIHGGVNPALLHADCCNNAAKFKPPVQQAPVRGVLCWLRSCCSVPIAVPTSSSAKQTRAAAEVRRGSKRLRMPIAGPHCYRRRPLYRGRCLLFGSCRRKPPCADDGFQEWGRIVCRAQRTQVVGPRSAPEGVRQQELRWCHGDGLPVMASAGTRLRLSSNLV